MANKRVRMLRNMGRYKAGDIYAAVPEWCNQLVAVGFAEELKAQEMPATEPAKPRRTRRNHAPTLEAK